jgi:Zn-dependent protease
MLSWSINLFRVRGIQLALHFSFVLWLGYAAVTGYQTAGVPGMLWSSGAMLVIFTCVVLHEFGHSFTAMHFGVGVRRILLMPIGGMAEFDSIPREPRREFLITIAGPAVNFAIACLILPFVGFGHGWSSFNYEPETTADLFRLLAFWNLGIGIFNLVPVFPMDGGRIFRALLATRLPYLSATYWAVKIGKVVAVAAIAIAYFQYHSYLTIALFLFIMFAGENEYRNLLRRDRYEAQWQPLTPHYTVLSPPPPSEEPPLLRP